MKKGRLNPSGGPLTVDAPMSNSLLPYDQLCLRAREVRLIRDIGSTLGWDQETYLPPSGVAWRADQMSWLGAEAHRRFTAPEVGDWIAAAEADPARAAENEAEAELHQANLREWRHDYDLATRLPVALVEEAAQAQAHAKEAWVAARQTSDFALFAPHLGKLIDISRRKADFWGYETCAYDALLDTYERGTRSDNLEILFNDLRKDLVPLVAEATSHPRSPKNLLEGHYAVEKQHAFNREVAEAVGFDFQAGRIDTTVHPFCTDLGPRDVRLTTRYDESDFRSSLFGVLHEAGHGLYEQGLPSGSRGQPAGDSVSLGVHESQSRLWENHVGRSLAFWEIWLPRAAAHFPHLSRLTPQAMYLAVNHAKRSLIRVEADEVTYDLHIMLRFEIERGIFSGDLAVQDIPGEWNARFHQLMGLAVPSDSQGCLQDIHWSLGGFGYFPTYSLGNLNAAHLFAAAQRKDPAISRGLAKGDYAPLLGWLRTQIHQQGRRHLPGDLITRAAGAPVSSEAMLTHLRTRYLS